MLYSAGAVSAMQFHIAPLAFIDEREESVTQRSPAHAAELLRQFHEFETGVAVQFYVLDAAAMNAPRSLLDAVRVCREKRVDYLLYGYVSRKEYTITTEIKLFEYANRAVVYTFYSMDDPEHYSRMLKDVAYKILEYIDGTFNLPLFDIEPDHMYLSVPAMVGYWSPLKREWGNLLLGTVSLTTGIRFIPVDRLFILHGFTFYLSFEFDFTYRLSLGNPNAYQLYNNSFILGSPVRMHMQLTEQHGIFAGFGLSYSFDLMFLQQRYSRQERMVYNTYGLIWTFGYRYALNESIRLLIDNQFDMRFYDTPMASYSLNIGIDFVFFTKDLKRKW